MNMSAEDRELDRLWREAFGQPLPILGAASVVRPVLLQMLAGRPQQLHVHATAGNEL